jgi:hypothetical protein
MANPRPVPASDQRSRTLVAIGAVVLASALVLFVLSGVFAVWAMSRSTDAAFADTDVILRRRWTCPTATPGGSTPGGTS